MTARLPIDGLGEPWAEPAGTAPDAAAEAAPAAEPPEAAVDAVAVAPARKATRARAAKRLRRKPMLAELIEPALLEDGADAAAAPLARDSRARLGELLPVLLSPEDIERVAQHQAQHGLLFGQAVVALALATRADVDWALSQQYAYSWVRDGESKLSESLVQAREPFGTTAEVFRDLRVQLMAQPELAKRALAVVGVQPGDGRSFVAANLAIACSQAGARTLLIDADLRTGSQAALFGLPPDDGLAGLLAGRRPRSIVRRVPQLPGVHVLGAGPRPPNPVELLQRPAFAALLAEVMGTFDVVIVDTPASERGADARVIAAACGAALVVAREDHTPSAALQDLAASLGRLQTHLCGVVYNPT